MTAILANGEPMIITWSRFYGETLNQISSSTAQDLCIVDWLCIQKGMCSHGSVSESRKWEIALEPFKGSGNGAKLTSLPQFLFILNKTLVKKHAFI